MQRFGLLFLIVFALSSAFVVAEASHDIIVDKTGQAIVLIHFNESRSYEITLPKDVVDVKVKGALYFIENGVLELSVGSTKEALVLYKTHALTSKQGELWAFQLEDIEGLVTLNLPKEATIQSAEPRVLIDDAEYKKITWENAQSVFATYSYSISDVPEIDGFEENDSIFLYALIIGSGLLILLLAIVAYFVSQRESQTEEEAKEEKKKEKKTKKKEIQIEAREDTKEAVGSSEASVEHRSQSAKGLRDSDAQQNIIKTLSRNEKLVITAMLEEKGAMKRNELERKTKLAKSSLASTLHNLEQKNLVSVDKTHTVHFVRLTEWFSEL